MNRTQDNRFWTIGGAAAAVLVAAAGWFLGIHPVLSDTSSIKSQTQDAESQNLTMQARISQLAREKTKLGSLTADLRSALAALPMDNAVSDFTRQLTAQATAAGVQLDSVSVGSFTPVTANGGPSDSAPTTTTASTDAPGQLISIEVTVNSTGTGARQLAFLHEIQVQGPRRALVTSTDLSAATAQGSGATNPNLSTMTTQLTVFAAPQSDADRARLEKLLTAK